MLDRVGGGRSQSSHCRGYKPSARPSRHCHSSTTSTGSHATRYRWARLRRAGPAGLPVRLRPGAGEQFGAPGPTDPPAGRAALDPDGRHDQPCRDRRAGPATVTCSGVIGWSRPRPLREGLASLQTRGAASYLPASRSAGQPEADHFIPRVRCGIDAVENLVLADRSCNNDKREPAAIAAAGRRLGWPQNRDHQGTLAGLASILRLGLRPRWHPGRRPRSTATSRSALRRFWSGTGQVDITHTRPSIVIEIT